MEQLTIKGQIELKMSPELDQDDELKILIEDEEYVDKYIPTWLTKPDAEAIVNHLQKVFNLKP